jgi:Tol biopolymer transport system component
MRILLSGVVALVLGIQVVTQTAAEEPYSVAYASFGPLNSAIYVANADGSSERMVIGGSVLDMNPSFAPDGRSILFTSRRHGSADIYRVNTDGSHLERLTDHAAFDDQAVMSPDGRSVAFVSSRAGQADIWLLDLQSKRVKNLTEHPGGDYRPAWSPDGRWIAFTSDRDSEGARAATPLRGGAESFSPRQITELYAMRLDGSGLRRITDGDACVGGAAWSPDGTRLAFYEAGLVDWRAMNSVLGPPTIPTGTSQIVTMELATGARHVVTSGPGRKYSPKWIGSAIGYVRGDPDEKRGVRQRVNPVSLAISFTDGREDVRGTYSSVNWAADGKRMVFHRAIESTWPPLTPTFSRDSAFRAVRSGVFPSYSRDGRRLMSNTAYAGIFKNNILVMNPDGTDRRIVFEHPTDSALAPVWSPDGDRIAFALGSFFAAGRAGASARIGIISADGTGLRMLTTGSENYGFPSWSPDGRRIVARLSGTGFKNLMIIDVASGAVIPLTSGFQNDNFPAWSPKGDRILFTSDRDGDWELYTITPDGKDLKRLTNSPGNDAHATWSHDGDWIAFASARAGFKDELPVGEGGGQGAGDIFVMRWDGSDVRQLTDDAFEEATPAFAPRGSGGQAGLRGELRPVPAIRTGSARFPDE